MLSTFPGDKNLNKQHSKIICSKDFLCSFQWTDKNNCNQYQKHVWFLFIAWRQKGNSLWMRGNWCRIQEHFKDGGKTQILLLTRTYNCYAFIKLVWFK